MSNPLSNAQSFASETLSRERPVQYVVVTGNTAVPIPQAREFVGFSNLSTAAQTATISAFDSLTASGQLLAPAMALAASAVYAPCGLAGVSLNVGLTVIASVAPTTGIMVFFR